MHNIDFNQVPYRLGHMLPTLESFRQAERKKLIAIKEKVIDGDQHLLFNYEDLVQVLGAWDETTSAGRGLIVNMATGEVVAACLTKFHNLGQKFQDGRRAGFQPGPCEVLVKLDGDYGEAYRAGAEIRIASRGSFDSESSAVAQEIWDAKYKQHNHLFFDEWLDLTPIFEVIHRKTHHVVKYDFEDLVLIACRNRFTGEDFCHDQLLEMGARLGMRVVERIPCDDLEEMVSWVKKLDGNHEGVVIRYPDGYRLKVKGDEYLRICAILKNISIPRLANAWLSGVSEATWLTIDEEFREQIEALMVKLDARLHDQVRLVEQTYQQAPQGDRQTFAKWAQSLGHPLTSSLIARRQLDQPDAAAQLARVAVSELIKDGRLVALLQSEGDAALAAAVTDAEDKITDYLWQHAPNREGRAAISKLTPALGKSLSTTMEAVIKTLQPEVQVQNLRAFVKKAPQFQHIDVDAVFASAPALDAPNWEHVRWVKNYPAELRTFLNRWRENADKRNATIGARRILADAIRSATEKNLFEGLGPAAGLTQDLLELMPEQLASMVSLCESMPCSSDPQGVVNWIAEQGQQQPSARAVVNQFWIQPRMMVHSDYLQDPIVPPFMGGVQGLEES